MAENWIQLADTDVFSATSAERLTIAGIKRVDDLSDICAQVTLMVRQAYILSNRDLGDDGTIPEGLKDRAISIAMWRFISTGVPRMPAIQTRERQEAAKEARTFLDSISHAQVGTTTTPAIGCKRHTFGPRHEDGV